MSKGLRMTPAQQSAAIERISQNLALRSGAGCGKTFVLARRFTELLMQSADENPLRRFVALTFTDKAALEMAQRVRQLLSSFARAAKGPTRDKLLSWLEEIDQARISTIHGFCSSLLRTYAVQAGLDPDFAVCPDELTVSQMSVEAAEQAILSAVSERDEPASNLLLSVSFDRLSEQLQTLMNARTLWRAGDYADTAAIMKNWRKNAAGTRKQAFEALATDAAIAGMIADLREIGCSDPNDELLAFLDKRLELIERILADDSARTVANFSLLAETPGRLGSKSAWGDVGAKVVRDKIKELSAAVGEFGTFAEEFNDPDELAAGAISAMVSLAGRAESIFAAQKRKLGVLDFTDLLCHSRDILENNADIRRALQGQIGQLLVDECQDTDALQAALILMAVFPDDCWKEIISGSGGSVTLPEGKLFFVGDAKQSIYRFRGAQVEVFESLCRQLGPARQEGLDLSFRTHDAGVEFVNHLFAPLMGTDYARIEAHRRFTDAANRGPSVEVLLAEPQDGGSIATAQQAVESQAQATAYRIRRMLDGGEKLVWDADSKQWRPVRAGDIAILFARMTNTLTYERELSRYGVDYYVVGGTGFFHQQEVYDVLNALRAIDNAFDDIAFMGLLRSSLVGLDDNALMHLASQFKPPYLPALRAHAADGRKVEGLDESQAKAMQSAVELLTRLHVRKDALGIAELIEQFLDATGYSGVLLSQFQGRRMLGNVRMLIDLAKTADQSGMTLADFVRQIGQRVMEEPRYEQSAVAGEADDVVRLMTIHKAKGLEFPVVIVPDLNAARRPPDSSLLIRSDWGITYRCRNDAGGDELEPPLSYRMAKWLEHGDARREDIRKLYVALTRHEDHLVLIGANQRKKDGGFTSGSYMDMIDSVLGVATAVDQDKGTVQYAKKYAAAVGIIRPQRPKDSGASRSAGQKILRESISAQAVEERIVSQATAGGDLPYVGPLPETVGRTELAVTALSEFARCPTMYHWRHELRVPRVVLEELSPDGSARSSDVAPEAPVTVDAGIDAATLGTLLHRCMEHLDLKQPQPAASLLAAEAQELGLEIADVSPLAAEFDGMLQALRRSDLWAQMLSAKSIHRELDFVMDFPPAVLRGQIDLLYEDAAGAWHIVDYKSDRVGAEGPDAHADRYRLQVMLYAIAAGRCAGHQVADATIYFLRSGVSCRFAVTPESVEAARRQVQDISRRLIASRRTGRYDRCQDAACRFCPYEGLCRTIGDCVS